MPAAADASTAIEFAEAFAEATSLNPASAASEQVGGQPAAGSFGNGFGPPDPSVFGRTVSDGNAPTAAASGAQPAGGATPAEAITEDRFAAVNHTRIAREVRGELMPDGGSMHLRLDPPELGALQVSLHMRDGVVTAAFQAQNEDAARLLSHTMGDLRTSLEAHGIVVDKLHVQQAPRDEPARDNPGGGSRQNATPEQQQDARREQQRKDMVQRLWDKLAGNAPLDLVA